MCMRRFRSQSRIVNVCSVRSRIGLAHYILFEMLDIFSLCAVVSLTKQQSDSSPCRQQSSPASHQTGLPPRGGSSLDLWFVTNSKIILLLVSVRWVSLSPVRVRVLCIL